MKKQKLKSNFMKVIEISKKGRTRHTKRLAIPKAILLKNKKEKKFLIGTMPGPHPKANSMPLGVLVRDILKITRTSSETRKILNKGYIFIDGKIRKDEKFPIGIMDSISSPKLETAIRIIVNTKSQLVPIETKNPLQKIAKIVNKHTVRGGKLNITLHDGRNILADNSVCVGDSVIMSVPEQKIGKVLKFESGAKCLVTNGKHAGVIAKLEKIITNQNGIQSEAILRNANNEEFITVAKYLFVVDDSYEGVSQ